MRHPPPWWLRLPIYLDWIGWSFVLIVLATVLAHGVRIRLTIGQIAMIVGAAVLLSTLDALGGLGRTWALLPRAGLAFPALLWCGQAITWRRFGVEDGILLAIGAQQLWILLACVAAEVRLRLRPDSIRM